MAGKAKTRAGKNRGKRRATTTHGRAKFAGTVVMTPPDGGKTKAVAGGTRIVASVAELSVARLPESGKKSELQLDIHVVVPDLLDQIEPLQFTSFDKLSQGKYKCVSKELNQGNSQIGLGGKVPVDCSL